MLTFGVGFFYTFYSELSSYNNKNNLVLFVATFHINVGNLFSFYFSRVDHIVNVSVVSIVLLSVIIGHTWYYYWMALLARVEVKYAGIQLHEIITRMSTRI